MTTPFDDVISRVKAEGYHNQRRQLHSDIVSRGIVADLRQQCVPLRDDLESAVVKAWLNARTPGARGRRVDLLVGEPGPAARPDLHKLRMCVENKSVWTAHRNVTARYDDLNEALLVLHRSNSEAVLVATVMIGVAPRVLNVADIVKKRFKRQPARFADEILPRLRSGDPKLWEEFDEAVSENDPADAAKTIAKFRSLPTRPPGQTHIRGFDYVLLVPVHMDNVSVPAVQRTNALGIDVDAEYGRMLEQICRAYSVRFHG